MNKMKVSGFNSGQFGDLVINTVAARRMKELFSDKIILSLGIVKKYKEIAPLFIDHPDIDSIHFWEGYDDFPTENDKRKIEKFDRVFHPMPTHGQGKPWFTMRHQTQEVCYMNGLGDVPPSRCYLEKWFDVQPNGHKYIAFAPFAGWYNKDNDKKLSEKRANQICSIINDLGYGVLQIGGPDEPKLIGALNFNGSIFKSVADVLSCKMLIHTDTFIGWAASAYEHPQIGLYSHSYYSVDGNNYVKNIQPINKNSIYLSAGNVNDIPDEHYITAIKELT